MGDGLLSESLPTTRYLYTLEFIIQVAGSKCLGTKQNKRHRTMRPAIAVPSIKRRESKNRSNVKHVIGIDDRISWSESIAGLSSRSIKLGAQGTAIPPEPAGVVVHLALPPLASSRTFFHSISDLSSAWMDWWMFRAFLRVSRVLAYNMDHCDGQYEKQNAKAHLHIRKSMCRWAPRK